MTKTKVLVAASAVSTILFCSCSDSDSQEETSICGEWKLGSIRTEIRNYPDPQGEDNQFNDDVYYTFNQDSTYQIIDGDYEELGTWSYEDSMLTLCPQDSINAETTIVHIVKLRGDSLVHESEMESEFGPILEFMTLVKVEDKS